MAYEQAQDADTQWADKSDADLQRMLDGEIRHSPDFQGAKAELKRRADEREAHVSRLTVRIAIAALVAGALGIVVCLL